jgi:hypothetical protein
VKTKDPVTAAQGAKAVEQCRTSGKSCRSWCREHNIRYSRFMYWQRRFLGAAYTKRRSVFFELPKDWPPLDWFQVTFRGGRLSLAQNYDKDAVLKVLRLFGGQ